MDIITGIWGDCSSFYNWNVHRINSDSTSFCYTRKCVKRVLLLAAEWHPTLLRFCKTWLTMRVK